MATIKQIRRRIRSIQSTQQITKAMEMVAASKLKRAQDRVTASRPYARRIQGILESLAAAARSLSHPLFEQRAVHRRTLIVLSSDKGLCGSFNMNIFRLVEKEFPTRDLALVPLGRRANQYFGRRGWRIPSSQPEIGDQADRAMAKAVAAEVVRMFLAGETDRVDILYTQFLSTMTRRVTIEPLLPIRAAAEPEKGGASAGGARAGARTEGGAAVEPSGRDYIFEPSPEAIFQTLLPKYVENRMLQAMAESLASEHSARMVSMGAATKNAADVIASLTLIRNRLRQAAITREISEIVGGAEALR
jgi:F-type H+-transporting ATPase subunit gamma